MYARMDLYVDLHDTGFIQHASPLNFPPPLLQEALGDLHLYVHRHVFLSAYWLGS